MDSDSQDLRFETRYTPVERLGRGGTSEVELMRDARIGREVAAKVLRTQPRTGNHASARFVIEACRQAQLEHPSIVPVYDVGITADGQLYFTMKRVRGLTLAEIIEQLRAGNPELQAKYSRTKLLAGFNAICLAVAFAHERGVVHRDIKPANIMFGDFGETYLLDWGISKAANGVLQPSEQMVSLDGVPVPATQGLTGTPGYMAPEQIRTPLDPVTTAVDIYALGATLFELLTLEALHPATLEIHDALSSTLRGADARASARVPHREVPPELEAVCIRATATEPAGRFASARALSQAIERYLEGDRDLAMRETLSDAHAEAAEAAFREAHDAPGEETRHRSDAMQALARALALNPKNSRAFQTLVRLLSEPLTHLPEEVRTALRRDQIARVLAGQRRAGLVAFPTAVVAILLCAVSGLRDATGLGVLLGVLAVYGFASLWASTWVSQPRWVPGVHALLSVIVSCFSARIVNPMFPTPMLLLLNAVLYACIIGPGSGGARWVAAIGGVLALVGVTILDISGLVPGSIHFWDGNLCFAPLGVAYGAHSLIPMVLLSGASILTGAGMVGRVCSSISDAETSLMVRNWQLRQLLPLERRIA